MRKRIGGGDAFAGVYIDILMLLIMFVRKTLIGCLLVNYHVDNFVNILVDNLSSFCQRASLVILSKADLRGRRRRGQKKNRFKAILFSCGDPTRTNDLWVMSPTSYQLLHSAMFNECKGTAFFG